MPRFSASAPDFAAFVTPRGAHLVRLGRAGGRWQAEAAVSATGAQSLREAAAWLCARLAELGGRRARVWVALDGFGVCHHVLSLPRAPLEVLKPVAERELMRLHPDLREPMTDIRVADDGGARVDVLAAGAPREMLQQLHDELASRGHELQAVVALPHVTSMVQATYGSSSDAAVLVLLLPDRPALQFFVNGEPKLLREPPVTPEMDSGAKLEVIAGQIEWGLSLIRQQHSAELRGVLVAGAAATVGPVQQLLRERLAVSVEALVEESGAGPLLAGAAVGAARSANLLPVELRPVPATERQSRLLGLATAATIALAAFWWMGAGVWSARSARAQMTQATSGLQQLAPRAAPMELVTEQRRAHAQRVAFLRALDRERARVPEALAALAEIAPSGVRLEALALTRAPAPGGASGGPSWQVQLSGSAAGASSADAVRAIDGLFRGIPQRLRVRDLRLERLDDPAAGAAAEGALRPDRSVALHFGITFIMLPAEELTP